MATTITDRTEAPRADTTEISSIQRQTTEQGESELASSKGSNSHNTIRKLETKNMQLYKVKAFTCDGEGGNGAGVAILDDAISDQKMQEIAKDVGFAETAFVWPADLGWNIRYFSPEIEIPFCGHATIGVGTTLGQRSGPGVYNLELRNGDRITVEAFEDPSMGWGASLQSPKTSTENISQQQMADAYDAFGLSAADLDPRLPTRIINAGANHLLIGIKLRSRLSTIGFSFPNVKRLQEALSLATVSLVHAEDDKVFHARNPFPVGGLYEDPATGAAAAALAGYLRELEWPEQNKIEIFQGEDIGHKSHIIAEFTHGKGESVRVSGFTKNIDSSHGGETIKSTDGKEQAMTVRTIETDAAAAPGGHYCQALTDGTYIYCSGIIAVDQDGTMHQGTAELEARMVLENLTKVLEAAGSSFDHVVKSTVFVTDMADFAAVNAVFAEFFGKHRPARCTIAVSGLPRGAKVEIDAVALPKN